MAQSQLNFDPRHVVDADMSMASKPPFKAEAQVGARARLGLAAVIAGFCLYAALLGAGWWATLHLLPDQLSGRVVGHVMILKNDLSMHSAETLSAVASTLNGRPRKTLGWKTPAEALDQCLAQLEKPSVATTG